MTKKSLLILAGVLFIQNFCQATMFLPLPIEKQVEEATSGAEVKLASSKVYKTESGSIMTEYRFDVIEAYNLSDEDLDNHQLKLTMTGGTYEGMTSMIDGAPQFSQNEKSFLLLKKIDSKIYLSNFTLGKFRIQEHEGKVFYVSEVFPTDPKVGKVSKEQMIELIKVKWKTSFSESSKAIVKLGADNLNAQPLLLFFKNNERRQPAQEMEIRSGVPIFFWSAIGIFAFFFVVIFFKLNKSETLNKRE